MPDVPTVDVDAFEPREARKPGAPPGQLRDEPNAPEAELTVIAYDESGYVVEPIEDLEELDEFHGDWGMVWLNVDGIGDADALRRVGEAFELSPLVLEDIQHVPQRPRVQVVEGSCFVTTLMPRPDDDPIRIEQVSLVFGRSRLVTFQQYLGGDVLDPVRRRIEQGIGRIRGRGAPYLAYAVIDTIVDSYLPLLDAFDRELTEIEAKMLRESRPENITELYELKRSIMDLERATRPQAHMVESLPRTGSEFFDAETEPYLRDCLDHAEEANELASSARQTASSLVDLQLSLAGQRMNEVMKILTMIATIFIPLTFIAGVYGMNFDPESSPWNMPELKWRYGYPVTVAVMAVLTGGMLLYFYRNGWIGDPE